MHFKEPFLSLEQCSGEKKVQIEVVDISDGLQKTGLKLVYTSSYPESVELGTSGTCFQTRKNLCGPESISFFSLEGDLVLTNCDGTLLMKKEYDYCG